MLLLQDPSNLNKAFIEHVFHEYNFMQNIARERAEKLLDLYRSLYKKYLNEEIYYQYYFDCLQDSGIVYYYQEYHEYSGYDDRNIEYMNFPLEWIYCDDWEDKVLKQVKKYMMQL